MAGWLREGGTATCLEVHGVFRCRHLELCCSKAIHGCVVRLSLYVLTDGVLGPLQAGHSFEFIELGINVFPRLKNNTFTCY